MSPDGVNTRSLDHPVVPILRSAMRPPLCAGDFSAAGCDVAGSGRAGDGIADARDRWAAGPAELNSGSIQEEDAARDLLDLPVIGDRKERAGLADQIGLAGLGVGRGARRRVALVEEAPQDDAFVRAV